MRTLNNSLGERIREIRKGKGMKQKELAAALHVEPLQVSRWERGEQVPELHRLRQLAALGGVSLDYLLSDAA